MDVNQHDDNEGKLGAAESNEDIDYDEDDYRKIDNDDEDNDDVYGDGNKGDQDKEDERLLPALNQQKISTKVRTWSWNLMSSRR